MLMTVRLEESGKPVSAGLHEPIDDVVDRLSSE
jgi:hypothetical protein